MLEQLFRASMSKRVGPGRARLWQPAVRLARVIVKPQHPEQWAKGNLPAAERQAAAAAAPACPQKVLGHWSSQAAQNFLLGGARISSAFFSRSHMKAIVDLFK